MQKVVQEMFSLLSLQFKEPMILLLLASGLVSVCMSQYDDAVSITVVCILICNTLTVHLKVFLKDHAILEHTVVIEIIGDT